MAPRAERYFIYSLLFVLALYSNMMALSAHNVDTIVAVLPAWQLVQRNSDPRALVLTISASSSFTSSSRIQVNFETKSSGPLRNAWPCLVSSSFGPSQRNRKWLNELSFLRWEVRSLAPCVVCTPQSYRNSLLLKTMSTGHHVYPRPTNALLLLIFVKDPRLV